MPPDRPREKPIRKVVEMLTPLAFVTGLVGSLVTISSVSFSAALYCSLAVLLVACLSYLFCRFCMPLVSREEHRRNERFLAAATDGDCDARSRTMVAGVCRGIEVNQVESFLKWLETLRIRVANFVRDARKRTTSLQDAEDRHTILRSILDDCLLIKGHHEVFSLLKEDFCTRSRHWPNVETRLMQFAAELEQKVLAPIKNGLTKSPPEPGRTTTRTRTQAAGQRKRARERRRKACEQAAAAAQLVIQAHLDPLIERVTELRDEAKGELHAVLAGGYSL